MIVGLVHYERGGAAGWAEAVQLLKPAEQVRQPLCVVRDLRERHDTRRNAHGRSVGFDQSAETSGGAPMSDGRESRSGS